jgi:hypothetical protein
MTHAKYCITCGELQATCPHLFSRNEAIPVTFETYWYEYLYNTWPNDDVRRVTDVGLSMKQGSVSRIRCTSIAEIRANRNRLGILAEIDKLLGEVFT